MGRRPKLALGALAGVIGVLAGAAHAAAPASVTIQIKGSKKPQFVIPDGGIAAGGDLTITDVTGGSFAGHTFSLVKRSALPTTDAAKKKCQRTGHICRAVKSWGEYSEVGQAGWDRHGDLHHTGDSSFLNGTSDMRAVSAPAGTVLYFMCAIHPKTMQGKIKVE